ncbi:MAG TPA: FAD-binding protein [Syntrophorhabdales bacterium]|nr:FAD-binding protein [Syntrophorhabdales bacterium]
MGGIDSTGKVVEADVLVVGGGLAGLWAATKAREYVDMVTIIDKGPKDWGGQCSHASGGIIATIPQDNVAESIKDLVYYYDGLCDQDLWGEIFGQSYDRIQDYLEMGYEFITEPDGRLKGIPQRSLEHIKCYLGKPFGMGGKNMVGVLLNKAQRLGVERFGRIMVTNLVKQDGRVIGATGFDTITGEFYIFKAHAVLLAVGNGGWKASYHLNTCAGDSVYLGLAAGAEATQCEFASVWNVPKLFSWEGQTYLLPLGARFVNAKGESFMDKYSPVFGANTDTHYITRAMAVEAREGRAPFYLDCTKMKPEDRELLTPKGKGWMRLNYLKLEDMGIHFFEEKSEWMPQMWRSAAGLAADLSGGTSVPGLFAAGRACGLDPTVYMGGLSLCLCSATGNTAGETAGRFAASAKSTVMDEELVNEQKRDLYRPVQKNGTMPKEVLREIQKAVFPCDVSILKNEAGLKRAAARLEVIKTELVPQMAAPDAHYLMKLMEVRSILLMSELYVRASLLRKESRAGHYREDYPGRDAAHWLGRLLAGQDADGIAFRVDPLPIDRYAIKPTRYYSDNFRF